MAGHEVCSGLQCSGRGPDGELIVIYELVVKKGLYLRDGLASRAASLRAEEFVDRRMVRYPVVRTLIWQRRSIPFRPADIRTIGSHMAGNTGMPEIAARPSRFHSILKVPR